MKNRNSISLWETNQPLEVVRIKALIPIKIFKNIWVTKSGESRESRKLGYVFFGNILDGLVINFALFGLKVNDFFLSREVG